jgi:methionyl aminopeptidase
LDDVNVLGIDFVSFKNGLFVDVARTLVLKKGDVSSHLTRVTHDASIAAITACKPGADTGVVASIFNKYAKENGYTVAQGLHSHFILNTLHGEIIPNTKVVGMTGSRNHIFEEGMVMAIEPIFNAGVGTIIKCQNDTAYCTADGKPSAHFEHTIVIEAGGPKIIA